MRTIIAQERPARIRATTEPETGGHPDAGDPAVRHGGVTVAHPL
ncbi:hypothetical protein [Leifsonia xyli]|nr:hypothetical protein [Leifsonia xyli]